MIYHMAGKDSGSKKKSRSSSSKRSRRAYDSDDYSESEGDSDNSDADGLDGGDGELSNILVIQGPTGSNKTAMVYHYARQIGYNVIEVNSNMVRSSSNVKKMISEGAQSQNLGLKEAGKRDYVSFFCIRCVPYCHNNSSN